MCFLQQTTTKRGKKHRSSCVLINLQAFIFLCKRFGGFLLSRTLCICMRKKWLLKQSPSGEVEMGFEGYSPLLSSSGVLFCNGHRCCVGLCIYPSCEVMEN